MKELVLKRKACFVCQAMLGIGKVTSVFLLFHFPILGDLSSRQTASLAGLASFTRDIGSFREKRSIYCGEK